MALGEAILDPTPRRWTVGDVTITRIVEKVYDSGLELYFPEYNAADVLSHEWLYPNFCDARGLLSYSIHALVIQTPDRCIVVDTCVGDLKPRKVFAQWDMLQTRFLENLRLGGFTPQTVDMVLCTHLHLDHVGWNTRLVDGQWVPTFENARYLFAQTEYDWLMGVADDPDPNLAHALDREMIADSIAPVFDAGLVDLVACDHRICNEVRLIPTPGHTAGHVSVVIESGGQTAMITGDACHHPVQLAYPEWGIVGDYDPPQSAASRRQIFEQAANERMLVIGTHWSEPTAGFIVPQNGEFVLDC
jgi:glyoxylase-like metal-dependent hydrolase (beta-lactamase superfamily II)